MNKYIIYAPHKCGSSILLTMTADITNVKIKPDKKFIIQTDIGDSELYFSRDLKLNPKIAEEHKLVFIPRNPISICISAYYSFGYTHRKPGHVSYAEFIEGRDTIQKLGLNKYVDNNIERRCISIQNILDFACNNKVIIPYELMIANFSDFLKNYLAAIEMSSSYQSAYSKWKSAFNPITDQSDLIESGDIKTHKRTTDIYEWKKKLSDSQVQELPEKYPTISEYLKLLSTYNL